MKWELKEPVRGDIVRVATSGLYHFGIYVSDEEVIQFGLPPSRRASTNPEDIKVLASDIDEFLAGGFLEVCVYDRKEKKKNRTPDEIVSYARDQIGRGGYHILYNNCEHFANECANGERVCHQTDDLRALFRSIPVVDVYLSELPDTDMTLPLGCKEREKEIASVSNERVRREKYFVWRLLCYALERSFGLKENKLRFTKNKHGRWSVSGAEISISHSDGALAVAVSRESVGIDIEVVRAPRAEKMAERIMSDAEFSEFENVADEEKLNRLIEIWTRKEALFKSQNKDSFNPKEADSRGSNFRSESIVFNDKCYIWSVVTPTPEKVRVFKVDVK